MQNKNSSETFASCFGKSIGVPMIYKHTSVFVVVGREEGPFSAPKALEAPMGELGPEPGALLVGVDSTKHQGVRNSMHAHTLQAVHIQRLGKQLLSHSSSMCTVMAV